MPRSSWLSSHTSASHLPNLLTPSSERAPSLANARVNPQNIPIPQTPFGSQSGWGNDDILSTSTPSSSYFPSSVPSTPAYEPSYSTGSSFHGHSSVEIQLDQDQVVLRGAGGDTNPARLAGTVILHLVESTNLKDVVLTLTGKAKVQFGEGAGGGSRSHHHTHVIINHEWNFLSQPVATSGAKKPTHHTHTLKAGIHAFPFSMMIESDTTFPSSLRTWNNEAHVSYKLRAVAIRSGAFSSNFQATKTVNLLRTYTSEALEFTQTLEIENSWPLKVAYSLTLPHKAFAAGDNIPIAVKFQPLMKGVHVTSISTVVKEYTLVHTKHSSHPDVRVAASIRHDIRNGKAYVHREKNAPDLVRPPNAAKDNDSPATTPAASNTPSFRSLSGGARTAPLPEMTSGPPGDGYFPQYHSNAAADGSPGTTPSTPNIAVSRSSISSESSGHNPMVNFIGGLDPATASHADSQEMYLQAREENREVELGDGEVDTMVSIPLPTWTTPSHSIHPVFVSHKIKWSCVISNPDGHTSELRCALPIVVLPPSLAEEARMASAHTRSVLFGCRTDSENENVVDLPSYGNHVYDRVANASVASSSGTTAAAWSRRSPASTPPSSRPGSRPGSPQLTMRPLASSSAPESNEVFVPERPTISWADSELLLSLGALNMQNAPAESQAGSPHQTPPDTRPSSRSGFRLPRSLSRPGSRASSPERGFSAMTPVPTDQSPHPPPEADRTSERKSSHGHGMFNRPTLSMKPFHSFSQLKHKGPSSTVPSTPRSSDHTPFHSPSVSSANLSGQYSSSASSSQGRPSPGISPVSSSAPSRVSSHTDVNALSQVPSYSVASRGFLGGGVVPLSAVQGLPDYDESENFQRTKSEGNLLDMSRRASSSTTPSAPLQDGLHSIGEPEGGLFTSASSSALASSLSTAAPGGTRAASFGPKPIAFTSINTFDDEGAEEDEDDEDHLLISIGKKNARSPSTSTIVPNRP